MFGTLKICVGVQAGTISRFVPVYTVRCERGEADKLVSEFKQWNPYLVDSLAEITWQSDREFL